MTDTVLELPRIGDQRNAALTALVGGGAIPPTLNPVTARRGVVALTGDEVYAGGDVRRVLTGPVSLTYRDEAGRACYAGHHLGDIALLTPEAAANLDATPGFTLTEDAYAEAANSGRQVAAPGPATPRPLPEFTDDQLAQMATGPLMALASTRGDLAEQIRNAELSRKRPRPSVLAAVDPADVDTVDALTTV